jgi:hypothetical protein
MPLVCVRCHQRIKKEAGRIDAGPVGPVCAQRLGLPRVLPQVLRKDGKPRAKSRRVRFVEARPVPARDPRQLDWVEVYAC